MDSREKQIILKKLDLTERGAMFILSDRELCGRIIIEDVIWTEDFIEKYGVSKKLVENLIKNGTLPYFSNYRLRKGCKKYFFEKEVAIFFSRGIYREGCIREFSQTVDLVSRIAELCCYGLELEVFRSMVYGNSSEKHIAKTYGLDVERIKPIVSKCFKSVKRYMREFEKISEIEGTHSKLVEQVENLKYEELILKRAVENYRKDLPPEASETLTDELINTKLSDLAISVRLLNILKSAEIETLYELTLVKRSHIQKFRNFGRKTLLELDELMDEHGLAFATEFDEPIKIT